MGTQRLALREPRKSPAQSWISGAPVIRSHSPLLSNGHGLGISDAVISRLLIWGCLLLGVRAASAAPLKFDTLKVGSKVYSNVTIVGANATDLYFTHSQGIMNVKLKYVDDNLKQRFHYDPKAAAEAERQQALDDTVYVNTLASNVVAQALKFALAKEKAGRTSEQSLADPVSEQSLLGKPAPPLEVEKWLGEKPSLKGKSALIAFWEPWSIPCRKTIPQLNALQKRFADKLVIVGVASDSQEEVEGMTDARIEFASALDSKGKLSSAAGVTSIPYVLLLDSQGIVRYQGHPSALDEKKIEPLLPLE